MEFICKTVLMQKYANHTDWKPVSLVLESQNLSYMVFCEKPQNKTFSRFFFFWTNILKICPKLSVSDEWKSYLCLHIPSSSCQRTLIIPTNKKSESWSVVEQPESGNLNVFAIKNNFSNNESTYQWKHE